MKDLHSVRFPNESSEYRDARNDLLRSEMELRRQIEAVAALRRKLPEGGALKEDYAFDRVDGSGQVRFSELFQNGKRNLLIYSYMYGPDDRTPCTSCTSILDGLDGVSPHANQRINLVVVAKSPAERIRVLAESRGWRNLVLLSSFGNSYNADYHAQDSDGDQLPAANVFVKHGDTISHFYGTELLYVDSEPGQDGRHVDLIWPLWNLFDLTPDGRGDDWYPELSYPTN